MSDYRVTYWVEGFLEDELVEIIVNEPSIERATQHAQDIWPGGDFARLRSITVEAT